MYTFLLQILKLLFIINTFNQSTMNVHALELLFYFRNTFGLI